MSGKFDRLMTILNFLDQESVCKAKSLADELGVSERSVFRYISSLQTAGFPIYFDKDRGTYAFPDGFRLKKAHLSTDETLVLALARKLLATTGEGFLEAFNKVEEKILGTSRTGEMRVPSIAFIAACQEIQGQSNAVNLMRDLSAAAIDHNLVYLAYEGLFSQELSRREVEPYYLYFSSDGFWYVRAYCRLKEAFRTFALDKVKDWRVLDRRFIPKLNGGDIGKEISSGFDTYVDGDPEEIVVRFSPEIRPFIERKKWHPSQKSKVLADDWLELTFYTPGVEAVKQWLYQWIPFVLVVKPDNLKKEMKQALKDQLALFKGNL